MDLKSFMMDNSGNPFVAFMNYGTRLFFAFIMLYILFGNGTFLGILISLISCALFVLIVHPLAWYIGDKFRQFTHPDAILTSGAMDTFNQRIFWLVVPQVISVTVAFGLLFFTTVGMLPTPDRKNDAVIASVPERTNVEQSVTNLQKPADEVNQSAPAAQLAQNSADQPKQVDQNAPSAQSLPVQTRGIIGAGIGNLVNITGVPGYSKGVEVREVNPQGAAFRAGFKQGDVIVSINNSSFNSGEELKSLLTFTPGKSTNIVVMRDNALRTLVVVPDGAPVAQ